jgi:hypothetical protein
VLSPSINSNRKTDNRTKQGKTVSRVSSGVSSRISKDVGVPMSLAHLNDSIGYENPHVLTHAKEAMKYANDTQRVRAELKHVIKHAEDVAKHNIKLHKKLGMLPEVKKEFNKLKQNKSF